MSDSLPLFIKDMRKKFGLTQVDLAAKSGVGLRFVRELEQGKETLRMDKVNQVLALFGHKVGAVPISCLLYTSDAADDLTEDENGFTFVYDADFLNSDKAEAISLTLPLTDKPYHDTVLFPFFDGLIPEGWLLNIAENSWKINQRDRMSLLLVCCKDCIGAVSVILDEPV